MCSGVWPGVPSGDTSGDRAGRRSFASLVAAAAEDTERSVLSEKPQKHLNKRSGAFSQKSRSCVHIFHACSGRLQVLTGA